MKTKPFGAKLFFSKTRKYHFFTVPWLGDGQPCYYVYDQLTANVRVVVWSHGHYLTYSVLLRNQSFEFLLRRATLAIVCSRLVTFHICVSFLHEHCFEIRSVFFETEMVQRMYTRDGHEQSTLDFKVFLQKIERVSL